MSHTQGKIKFRRGKEKEHEHDFIITGNRGALVAAYSPFEYAASAKMIETHNANARRLVACWNACNGISTEELEAGAIQKLQEQRDELLAALRSLIDMDVAYQRGPKVADAVEKAREAIAKAEGNHD